MDLCYKLVDARTGETKFTASNMAELSRVSGVGYHRIKELKMSGKGITRVEGAWCILEWK